MVVANQSLAALELYTFPVPKGDTGPTTMTRVVSLGLPSVAEGCSMALRFDNLFPKSIVSRMCQQLHDASIFAKPFTSASPDIISVELIVTTRSGSSYDHSSFVVHSSTLRRHARAFLQDTIPWQMWGPTTTRWHQHRTKNVRGQRWLLEGPKSMEIWDFNQYRVRCLGQGFAMESEAACVSVETEPSCVTSWGFKAGFYSSLPYVKLVLKQLKSPRPATWLDDDRILCYQVSPNHFCSFFLMTLLQQHTGLGHFDIVQLYFG
jgi:hypothetical protein